MARASAILRVELGGDGLALFWLEQRHEEAEAIGHRIGDQTHPIGTLGRGPK